MGGRAGGGARGGGGRGLDTNSYNGRFQHGYQSGISEGESTIKYLTNPNHPVVQKTGGIEAWKEQALYEYTDAKLLAKNKADITAAKNLIKSNPKGKLTFGDEAGNILYQGGVAAGKLKIRPKVLKALGLK